MKSINILVTILILFTSVAFAQSDMDLLNDASPKVHEPLLATFKGTRLINFHTNETPGKRTLEFRISHRFGAANGGAYNAFGLDGGASIRLGNILYCIYIFKYIKIVRSCPICPHTNTQVSASAGYKITYSRSMMFH
jgi:hypothetical protein